MTEMPKYIRWLKLGLEQHEDWEDLVMGEYPEGDAPEKVIIEFVKHVKKVEDEALDKYLNDGYTMEEAEALACQWPLIEDAPMEIVRDYIGSMHDLQEAQRQGIDL